MNEKILDKVLYLDSRTRESVHEELEKIFNSLVDFQEHDPRVYQLLCEHKRDFSLADALQALAQTLEVLKSDG
jgi:predicted component of type VI protein secretion system